MNAWSHILKYEILLIKRHYVFQIVAVSLLLYIVVFYSLTPAIRHYWLPALLFSEVISMSVLLISGLVFLEKKQQSLAAYLVTPRGPHTWILSKLVIFSLISSGVGLIMLLIFSDHFSPTAMTFCILGTILYNQIGLLITVVFKEIRQFLLPLSLAMGVSGISIYAYFGFFDTWLYWIIPSHTIMQGIACNLHSEKVCDNTTYFLLTSAWILLLYVANVYAFYRCIRGTNGD